jgi:hypothetical protein
MIMKKSTCMSSASRRCWTQQPWQIRSMTVRTETAVRSLAISRVPMGTRPAVLLHQRSCTQLNQKWFREQEHVEQDQYDERDYDYYGPFYDQPHRQCSPEGGQNLGGVKACSHDLRRMCWPLNFKMSGIERYDGSTNPAEWLEVYQLAIEDTRGVSYVMANYLPIYLSSSTRTWLLGLPTGSVRCWHHLCRLFTNNIYATCARSRVD